MLVLKLYVAALEEASKSFFSLTEDLDGGLDDMVNPHSCCPA